ncbi:MAG: hypothetical protein HY832_04130 [Candidatus Aenigmarchaeota archaeon]|nr:hypothetical protein [Candidatus Aenigmarchaeota archaeon]
MKQTYLTLLIILLTVGTLIFQVPEQLIVLGVLVVLSIILFAAKTVDKKHFFIICLAFVCLFYFTVVFYGPAVSIAKGAGVIYGNNWWESMLWIKNNTPECTTVATYWDPGHFIAAIAQRAVVFDGASQNDQIYYTYDGENYTVYTRPNENTTTHARIQDISTALFTGNETQAMELLKKYRKPGCNDMYFIASNDLIFKSGWWSYFSTWTPEKHGTQYGYQIMQRVSAQQVPSQNAVAYSFADSNNPDQVIVVFDKQGELRATFQQGNSFLTIKDIFYVDATGQGLITSAPDAQVNGMVYVLGNNNAVIYMPPELEQSLFTKMFFFNGAGLKNFEFIKDYGQEVKLFKVHFDGNGQTVVVR